LGQSDQFPPFVVSPASIANFDWKCGSQTWSGRWEEQLYTKKYVAEITIYIIRSGMLLHSVCMWDGDFNWQFSAVCYTVTF